MSTMLKVNKEDYSITTNDFMTEYAEGLVNAIGKSRDSMEIDRLLGELRMLHRENSENVVITEQLAKCLVNAFNNQTDPEKAGILLDELRALHEENPENVEIMKVFATGLYNASMKEADQEKAAVLLNKAFKLLGVELEL